MQKERMYLLNGNNVSFDLFQKVMCWVKNSNLTYRLIEEYDIEEDKYTHNLRIEDLSLLAFLEQLSDYNERLEQRLNKL